MREYSVFSVSYHKLGKPNGTRKFKIESQTYESILFNYLLNKICMSNYDTDYFYAFQGAHLFLERISANLIYCNYRIKVYDLKDWNKQLCEYNIDIECVENNSEDDILEETYIERKKAKVTQKRDRIPFDEKSSIKRFLFATGRGRSFKKYKQVQNEMAKSTYYKNKRYCVEKGYIVDGKLKKEIRDWLKFR